MSKKNWRDVGTVLFLAGLIMLFVGPALSLSYLSNPAISFIVAVIGAVLYIANT